MSETTFTYYATSSGHTYVLPKAEVSLFHILDKLGLKTVPKNIGYTVTVSSSQLISYTHGQICISTNSFAVTGTSCTGITVDDVQMDQPKAKGKGFTREEKRGWRDQWKKHSKRFGHQRR